MIEGKLYSCPDYCLLIYPTKEMAGAAAAGPPSSAASTAARVWASPRTRAKYWSKRLNCTVRYSGPNEIFMCLNESKDEFAHVLFGEKQGWIIVKNWLKIEEIKQ